MLAQWEQAFPGRTDNIFKALQNVSPSQLADSALFDFAGLTRAIGGRTEESAEARNGSGTESAAQRLEQGSESTQAGETLWREAAFGTQKPSKLRIDALNLS